jgi:hypothetical protein
MKKESMVEVRGAWVEGNRSSYQKKEKRERERERERGEKRGGRGGEGSVRIHVCIFNVQIGLVVILGLVVGSILSWYSKT